MALRIVDDALQERDLIDGCRQGHPAAQRQVFDTYRDRVYSIALHYLKGDDAGALDVTQDVFVRAFRALPQFRAEARLSTWLYRVVVNACLDELRRRRKVLYFGDVPASLHPAIAPDEPNDLDADVKAALARLSPTLRLTVLLRHFEDLSYDEMAEALGCSPGTVASRLSRAHAALARDLAHRRPESTP
jgi:RNA polymerase sigma-70 factor (ECF subfamily)